MGFNVNDFPNKQVSLKSRQTGTENTYNFSGKANFVVIFFDDRFTNPTGMSRYSVMCSTEPDTGYTNVLDYLDYYFDRGQGGYGTNEYIRGDMLAMGVTLPTKEEAVAYYTANPLYVKYSDAAFNRTSVDSIYFEGDGVPILTNTAYITQGTGIINGSTVILPTQTGIGNYGNDNGKFVYVMNYLVKNTLTPSPEIYHDIYIEGGDETTTVYIHSHHNVSEGFVTSNINYDIGRVSDNTVWDELNPNYVHFSTIAYDRGSLIDSSFINLRSRAQSNYSIAEVSMLRNKDVGLQFKDSITSQEGVTEYTSQYALIGLDKSHALKEPIIAHDKEVFIRFFEGAPPEEIQNQATRGETGDPQNYNGTPHKRKENEGDEQSSVRKGSKEGSLGIFHNAYLVSDANMRTLHDYLWTQSFFDVLKVNENPIDNIISCKRLPFTMPTSGSKSIRIGNKDTNVVGGVVTDGVYEVSLGTVTLDGIHSNFLDFTDTNLAIYLPFIGIKPIPTSYMYKTLKVDYLVDIVTGVCKAQLIVNNYCIAEYDGIMGIDCTLTASTQKQSEIANATRLLGGIGGTASGVMAMGSNPLGGALSVMGGVASIMNNNVQNHFQSTSSNAPISNASYIDCFIIYDDPLTSYGSGIGTYPNGYESSIGYPSMLTARIGDLSGFVKCYGEVNLSNDIIAPKDEKDEIIRLLKEGVVL